MTLVTRAILGDMEICFQRSLQVIGCDEYNVYLADQSHKIDGLPYILTFTKEWRFVEAATGTILSFEYKIRLLQEYVRS